MRIADKRKRYYTKIYIYEKRRAKLRERFGIKNNRSVNKDYNLAVLGINMKIKGWKKEIRKIDTLTKKLKGLEKAVVSFVGVPIRDINGQNLPVEVTLAKGIFYKYAQENGLRGIDALRFIGGKGTGQALSYRNRFTSSFANKPENKQKWLLFKSYYEETLKTA